MKPKVNDYIASIISSNVTTRGKFANMRYYQIFEIINNDFTKPHIKAKRIRREDITSGAKLHYFSELHPHNEIELID
jgi:hypothetical protein